MMVRVKPEKLVTQSEFSIAPRDRRPLIKGLAKFGKNLRRLKSQSLGAHIYLKARHNQPITVLRQSWICP
jgi:hypothetical protein